MSLKRVGRMGINSTQQRSRTIQQASGLSGPVQSLLATATGARTASLSWTAPAIGNPTSYVVSVSPSGGSISYSGTTANITGLTPETSYTFTTTSINSVGSGIPITSNQILTLPAPVVTGGTKTTYGLYTVNTFTANDTMVVSNGSLSVDILCVAGGGGGARGIPSNTEGGGGGAGGMIVETRTAAVGSYPVSVGGGGAGRSGEGQSGGNGGNSVISGLSSVTSIGGGGGGGSNAAGLGGGSGGGGGGVISGTVSGGAGTSGQGNNGATGGWDRSQAGGGGGRSSAGSNASGGAGLANNYRSGTNVTYSSGGTGAGGASAAPNTGNGGAGHTGTSGSGGSGIVVVRYLTP
jgi:hypothetical protein